MHYPMGIGWIWKAGASEVTVKIVALVLVFDYCYLSVFWDNAIFPGFPSFFLRRPFCTLMGMNVIFILQVFYR